ncbi:MAG: hypothetical protein Q4G09_05940 [Clostridia bacterium]|nr:hypothetical protein [Clostridia bacterium]
MDKLYSLKDIVVPYINLNSDDANKVNNEIKELFDEMAQFFEEELTSTQTWYRISSYKYFINDNILSILITTESGGSAVETYEYHTYNFDLKTSKLLDYKSIYNSVGYTSDNIDSKVETAINNYERLKEFANEFYDKSLQEPITFKQKSINNYYDSVANKKIAYFLDSNGKLNVIVRIEMPIGIGEFDTILTIE